MPIVKPSIIAQGDLVVVVVSQANLSPTKSLVRNLVEWIRLGPVQAVVLHHLEY